MVKQVSLRYQPQKQLFRLISHIRIERMKKYWLLILAITAIIIGLLMYYAYASPLKISSEEAKRRIFDRKVDVVLDVRTNLEYNLGHYPESLHIPTGELNDRIEKEVPNKEARILVYCNTGQRSRAAAELLHAKGYKNTRYITGPHWSLLN